MYKAIIAFTDLADGNRGYLAGDTYPREGYTPNDGRITELLSTTNKLGRPVIEYIEPEKPVEVTEIIEKPVEVIPETKKRRRKNA